MTTTGSTPGARALPAPPGKPGRTTPIFRHPWRVAVVVGALLLVANLGVFLLSQSDTKPEGREFPVAIDTVSPLPGELIRPQDTVSADLRSDLTGVLVIDGQEVPEDQLDPKFPSRNPSPLGIVSFRPGEDKDLEKFAPGAHSIAVRYWEQTKQRPSNPASYSWSFRVGA